MTRLNLKSQLYGFEVSTVELDPKHHDEGRVMYETMIMGYKGEWLDFQIREYTIQTAFQAHLDALNIIVTQYKKEVEANG